MHIVVPSQVGSFRLFVVVFLWQWQSLHGFQLNDLLDTMERDKENLIPDNIEDIISNVLRNVPSAFPSLTPSSSPTSSMSPSTYPSTIPSSRPSMASSTHPSTKPSSHPSLIPTSGPSEFPSWTPSLTPSLHPSHHPSFHPSIHPSHSPTQTPSIAPSLIPSTPPTTSHSPTLSSSSHPSQEPTNDRSRGFWTYNPKSKYGPRNWESRNAKGDRLFVKMTGSSTNRCEDKQKQSPIVLDPNAACNDDHQIHTQRGNKDFETLEFQVLPQALRVVFPPDEGTNNRCPRADFSNLSDIIPAGFMDVKMPAEHKIENEQGDIISYPGEIQIYHDWGEKVVIISWFFDYAQDEHNEQLEDFIRMWEDIHENRLTTCANRKRPFWEWTFHFPKFQKRSAQEMMRIWGDPDEYSGTADYDLYRLQPTAWYYGYTGSSTSPPCGTKVYWRIQDLPMKISHDQYLRLQRVLLDQRDEDCKLSSISYKGGVNRPIQKRTQTVWKCNADNWGVRFPEVWCGKWPEGYHGVRKLRGACPEHE